MEHETFWSLLTNLPHLEFEIFLTLVQDVVIGLLVWPWIKRLARKEHRAIDKEHGVDHNDC